MKNVRVITNKDSVRKLIKEALNGSYHPAVVNELPFEEPPVVANPISGVENVDSPLDPPVEDDQFVPTNNVELAAATEKLSKQVPPEKIAKFYNDIKNLVKSAKEEQESELIDNKPEFYKSEEQITTVPKDKTRVESFIRKEVKRLIEDLRDKDLDLDDDEKHDDDQEYEVEQGEEATFAEIAQEMGFTPQNAQALINSTAAKLKVWGFGIPNVEREQIILTAVNDYIEYLTSSGELDQDEVQLLKKHPEFIQELDGFREFMRKYINAAIRKTKEEPPSGKDDSSYWSDDSPQYSLRGNASKFAD